MIRVTTSCQVSFIVALSLSLYAGFIVLHYEYGPHAGHYDAPMSLVSEMASGHSPGLVHSLTTTSQMTKTYPYPSTGQTGAPPPGHHQQQDGSSSSMDPSASSSIFRSTFLQETLKHFTASSTAGGRHGRRVKVGSGSATRSVVRVPDSWGRKELTSTGVRDHGPCSDHGYGSDEVAVVRMCCELTEGKMATIKHWSSQLQGIDLWILFDYKDMDEEGVIQLQAQFKRLQIDHSFSVFLYNHRVAERMYPGAKDRLEALADKVNWAIHEVSIAAWWRVCAQSSWGDELRQHGKKTTTVAAVKRKDVEEAAGDGSGGKVLLPRYVWSIEADAMFAGDPMVFFDHYRQHDDHFVVGWVAKAQDKWIAEKYEKLSNMSSLPYDTVYSKPDAVMRMSSRLMYHMDVALRCNLILYGEMYASTICLGVYGDWCSAISLMDGPFYSPEPGGFNSVRFLNETEWEARLTDPRLRNRWYHPIAALKEHKRKLKAHFP